MSVGEPEPPKHLGDHPDGASWSADPPPGHPESDEPDVPLWDGAGLLPEEPGWLQETLGLSDSLIDDLGEWGDAMNHLDGHPPLRTEKAFRHLDERARVLVTRLQQEVGSRFNVTYTPW
jgi:hypothetical protein